jgi:hypothetical protein
MRKSKTVKNLTYTILDHSQDLAIWINEKLVITGDKVANVSHLK